MDYYTLVTCDTNYIGRVTEGNEFALRSRMDLSLRSILHRCRYILHVLYGILLPVPIPLYDDLALHRYPVLWVSTAFTGIRYIGISVFRCFAITHMFAWTRSMHAARCSYLNSLHEDRSSRSPYPPRTERASKPVSDFLPAHHFPILVVVCKCLS